MYNIVQLNYKSAPDISRASFSAKTLTWFFSHTLKVESYLYLRNHCKLKKLRELFKYEIFFSSQSVHLVKQIPVPLWVSCNEA